MPRKRKIPLPFGVTLADAPTGSENRAKLRCYNMQHMWNINGVINGDRVIAGVAGFLDDKPWEIFNPGRFADRRKWFEDIVGVGVDRFRQWVGGFDKDLADRFAIQFAVADAADKRGKHTENRGNRYTIDKLVEDAIEDAADKRGSQQSRNQYQHDQHDSRRTGIARSSTYNPDADNTATAMIRRLARQGHDELIEQIRLGELSPNAAAIQAGFRKRQISVPVGDAEGLIRRALKHYTPEQLVEALDSVQNRKN